MVSKANSLYVMMNISNFSKSRNERKTESQKVMYKVRVKYFFCRTKNNLYKKLSFSLGLLGQSRTFSRNLLINETISNPSFTILGKTQLLYLNIFFVVYRHMHIKLDSNTNINLSELSQSNVCQKITNTLEV